MAEPADAADGCLLGADAAGFLLALAVVWTVVVVLLTIHAGRALAERRPRRAVHRAPAAARTVEEIRQRLRVEADTQRTRRVVTVLPRPSATPRPPARWELDTLPGAAPGTRGRTDDLD